jgi:hypothetical protein
MTRWLLAACLLPSLALAQPRLTVLEAPDDPMLRLGSFAFEGGRTLELSVGIGSGAYRRPTDRPDIVYFLSDRGPNIACGDAEAITGVPRARLCAQANAGRVYPVPGYAPSIYGVQLDEAARRFRVFEAIAIKRADGTPLSGLTNPLTGRTETPLDGAGRVLPFDAGALDMEGLIRLPDGRFWVGEENAPSIAEISPEGRVLRRIVPAGTEGEFAQAGYPVQGGLPAILARRQSNRGIESLAGTPDGATLYFIMQNPLANPDAAAYRAARNARLFRFDPATGRVTGQWVYQLEDPRSFRLDPSENQSDPRISELTWLGPDRLLVLERTERTTKLFEVRLDQGATEILGSRWDDPATRPTLEQSNDLSGTGITPLAKRLVMDTADHPEIPGKVEGIALLPDGTLLMVNDDDFGITGERTRIVLVRGLDLRW